MKKIRSAVVGLVVVFMLAGVAFAQTPLEGNKPSDYQKGRIFQELNLTADQKQKLEANRKVQREEMKLLFTAMKERRVRLQEVLKSPAVTRAAVEPLVNEIKALQGQMIDHRVNGIFAVKEILTPEQFAKFQQIVEKRQEVRKERFQERRENKAGYEHQEEY